jgi:hypothetical protein
MVAIRGRSAVSAGTVEGGVRVVMQLEGLMLAAAAVLLYGRFGGPWETFALYFLVPDLSMLGYLAGRHVGAFAYNLAHTYVGPSALIAWALVADDMSAMPFALIWLAHIGVDRMLGFGLKYATGFGDTHLGHLPWPRA